MHLFHLPVVFAFVAVTTDALQCDSLTQFPKNDQCCSKCGPGTSMSSISTCQDPQCKECGENEYQDNYTNKPQCERQPYCDPNRNFEVVVHESKKKRTICVCKVGFHCSTEACITCVPHTTCEPGFGAQQKGNHSQDTVCQKCPEGTFSSERSWDGACKKWTECQMGYHVEHRGTDTSDNKCETRAHIIAIGVISAVAVLFVLAGIVLWQYRAKRGYLKVQAKGCFESHQKEEIEPQRETKEAVTRAPEENEDDPSLEEMSRDVRLTEGGNYVAQENGKIEILSRQESQTQTFSDV